MTVLYKKTLIWREIILLFNLVTSSNVWSPSLKIIKKIVLSQNQTKMKFKLWILYCTTTLILAFKKTKQSAVQLIWSIKLFKACVFLAYQRETAQLHRHNHFHVVVILTVYSNACSVIALSSHSLRFRQFFPW